jgi:phage terminase large subunit
MSESRLNISLECRTLLKELRLYAWDQNKATLTPLDKDNHAIDALCYALTG